MPYDPKLAALRNKLGLKVWFRDIHAESREALKQEEGFRPS